MSLEKNVSAIIQRKLPPKWKDQGMFVISYKIGTWGIKKAMCDLGALINIMPLSIYSKLYTDPLKETGVIILLTDKSIIYPEGV